MRELSVNFVRGLLESQCPDMRIDSLESYPNAGAMNLIFKMNKNILIRLPNGQISEDQLSREICSLRHIKPLGRGLDPFTRVYLAEDQMRSSLFRKQGGDKRTQDFNMVLLRRLS